MELINGNSEIIKDFFQSMERMLDGISRLAKGNKPTLNGERFLGNNEVAKLLNVSIRTLQDWRDNSIIPYIQIKGKSSIAKVILTGSCSPLTMRNGRNNLPLKFRISFDL